jgi:5'-methylthioadenosine phosphorylase
VATEGPRLETPAEIRKFVSFGGDLVGQTVVPEVFLARELEMCYAVLCYVTNFAEGIIEREFKEGVLFEGLSTKEEQAKVAKAFNRYPEIISQVADRLPLTKIICHCGESMLRYKKRGDIGENWREWLSP